jgi:glycerate 2-kinase
VILCLAAAISLSVRAILDGRYRHSYFQALGDLVLTWPTPTNVNDIRAVLIA